MNHIFEALEGLRSLLHTDQKSPVRKNLFIGKTDKNCFAIDGSDNEVIVVEGDSSEIKHELKEEISVDRIEGTPPKPAKTFTFKKTKR